MRLAQAAQVRVPSRKSRQNSERLHTWQARAPPVADRSLKERGGEHLSMRHLVAEKGELGEDHSECTSDQQLQPGVVEEDQPRSPHHPTRSANQRNQWKARGPQGEGRGQSESRTRETSEPGPKSLRRIIDRCEAGRASRTIGRIGRLLG